MRLADFDYKLPEALIAKVPAEPRDRSRLLVVDKTSGERAHRRFFELGDYLRAGDLLVVNDSRVIPARLFGQDETGRRFEVLLLKARSALTWECLAKPGKKLKPTTLLHFPDGVTAGVERNDTTFIVEFKGLTDEAFLPWLEKVGEPPLPPYFDREAVADDKLRYQTIYAHDPGSVAAPTAGLHFTASLLDSLQARGIQIARVTLHVGYGTFAPVKAEHLDDHVMHEESYTVPADLWDGIRETRARGNRVIAVGTTSLRALESGQAATTRLFIRPGYEFKHVDGLITNFHLPKSTLFVLVAAFLGLNNAKSAYDEAIAEGYRFFSYGDAMLIV